MAGPVRSVDELMLIANSCSDQDEQTCAICIEYLKSGSTVRVLQCGHKFHPSCIDRWLQPNITCPSCNTQVLLPMATPVEYEESSASAVSYGRCRSCQRQFYRDATMNPSHADYFRCPEHRGFSWGAVLRGSCSVQ